LRALGAKEPLRLRQLLLGSSESLLH
jgi:hypothetical protein